MNISSKDKTIVTHSPAETQAVARSLLSALGPGNVVALHGELGSGKTCFVQGLARALGIRQAVTSPSYTLIHEYAGRPPLVHVDLYRLRDLAAVAELALEEYWDAGGITAIEWAERAGAILPAHTVHVYFEVVEEGRARAITIQADRYPP